MRGYRLTLFFITILVCGGLFSLYEMPKEEFPDFDMPMAVMVAVYPGATAEQMENEVMTKLENYVYSFQDLNKDMMSFVAQDGICYSILLADPDCKNSDQMWNKMKQGLPLLQKTTLPPGVLGVELIDNLAQVPTMLVSIASKDKSSRELEDYVEQLRTKLRNIDGITDLSILGSNHEQISIYLDKDRMVKYGVTKSLIQTQLALQGLTLGGAHADDNNVSVPIYVTETFQTERDIANEIIFNDPEGNNIRLKDVARVVREYSDQKSYISNNSSNCLLLQIQMKNDDNITFFGADVDDIVNDFKQTLPKSVHVDYIVNQPSVVNNAIFGFLRDLVEAVVIVILIMMILFPFRSALVAGISIPFTMLFTLLIMYNMNIPLNTVTLAALIVVLGMVVDDGIVIIDNHQQELRNHHSSWFASIMGAHKLFPSICIATISICLVFVPGPFVMPKMLYNIIFGFVATVIIAMMCSLFTAMVLVPILNHKFLGKSTSGTSQIKESKLLKPVEKGYEKLLNACFRHPWITISSGIAVVTGGGLLMYSLNIMMLPAADRNQFVVEVHTPAVSSIKKTAEITDSVSAILQRDSRVTGVTEFVGQLMPRFMVTAPVALVSNSFSQMIVTTKSDAATIEMLNDYTGYFNKKWPGTYVRMLQLNYCPNGGVSVKLFSDDFTQLHVLADSIETFMRNDKDVIWVLNDASEKIPAVAIDVNKTASEQLGISKLGIVADMATKYGGLKLGEIWEGNYEMPIYLYASDKNDKHNLGDIGDDYVASIGGGVPLRQIADTRPEWHESNIHHENCQRSMVVNADVARGASVTDVMNRVEDYLSKRSDLFPKGTHWEMGGTSKINEMIAQPLIKSLLFSITIILFIMVFNFRKIQLAALAMVGVAFALPGAAIGQWLSGYDIGLTSTLGISSLLGIMMRNAIIMFDYAQELRKDGMSARDAAFNAGKRRMTPIFLTAATTAVGVIPIILEDSALWAPMGWIICFGTFCATFLIVTVMPCAYWKVMEGKKG